MRKESAGEQEAHTSCDSMGHDSTSKCSAAALARGTATHMSIPLVIVYRRSHRYQRLQEAKLLMAGRSDDCMHRFSSAIYDTRQVLFGDRDLVVARFDAVSELESSLIH